MKRIIKIVLAVVGVLVALVVVAAVALPLLVDVNDYKPRINAAIERQIGREVNISGDIDLSVFPWLGVKLGEVSVANAEGFGDQPMARMRSAEISVRLLPLLSRDIEVGTVSLDGLDLRLARNADGRTNWDSIAEHLAASDNESPQDDGPAPPDDEAGSDSGFQLSSLQIGAIEVSDAAVSWKDATTGADYSASGVKLATGRLTDGEPFRVEFGGHFAAPAEDVQGDLSLVGRVEPDIAERFYRFTDVNLSVLASGNGVPGGQQQASLAGTGELDMAEGRFKVAGASLQAAGLNVTGNVDGSGLNGTPSYTGRITVKNFDPRTLMDNLGMEAPATQNDDALSSAGFDAQFDASNDRVRFKQILATLDDSSLSGTASIENFAQPSFGFDLDLDQLNVDDYLPPGSAEQAKTGQPAETGGGSAQKDAEIDLSALKDLRLDGKLSVGQLTAANMQVSNAELAVKARNGVLTIEPLTADLYNGNLRLSARIDASRDTPRYALKGNLNGLQFAPLLEDVAGTNRVSALANMSLDVATAGKQVASMKRALTGDLSFDLRDGAFNGFDLAQVIEGARARLRGDSDDGAAAGVGGDKKTVFNRLAGSFNVNNGVLAGKDLKLDSKVVNAQGAGNYDLADNALDYTINARVPDNASGKLAELAGVSVPIHLSGNLLSPNYRVDIAGALKGLADQRLQEEKAKLQDKVRDKLKERSDKIDDDLRNKIQQGLQGLLGGGSKKSDGDE